MKMRFKTRLIVAFITITVIPMLLSFSIILGLGAFQINRIQDSYGITGIDYQSLSSSLYLFDTLTDKLYDELKVTAEEDADQLEDAQFLQQFNQRLTPHNSYLVIKQGAIFSYIGDSVKFEELGNNALVLEDAVQEVSAITTYIEGESPALMKCVAFTNSNDEQGIAYIITDASQMLPEMEDFLTGIVVTIVAVLILTGMALVFWIRQGVLEPLNKMRLAAQNIKDGNLEFELVPDSDDELGQLCKDFEEMRQRLRDNAQEKLVYDKESKELISNISHDLKTPITAIKGYAEGIMDGVADTDEKRDKYIRTIYNKANEMNMLINELTLYSKVDTNRIPYEFHTLSVDDYFDDCAEDLSLELESKGVEFVYHNYAEQGTKVIGDPEQIKRVIHNIVNNSVKYMDKEKPYISLHLKDVGDFIQIDVEDNGKGIESKDLPYVFDRFYRTDTSRNSATGGSGIGLSIVKKIIEEHGGKIWATSRLGVGTVMHFVIRKYQEVPNE